MTKFTDDTPVAMLTVGQLKEILDWLQSESHPTIGHENIQRINQLKKH